MHLFAFRKLLSSAAVAGCTAFSAQASVLLQNWDGTTDTGFGNLLMTGYNFFGTCYGSFWVNNIGNITVNGPFDSFTPDPFPSANEPMIAPFWADVNLTHAHCCVMNMAIAPCHK